MKPLEPSKPGRLDRWTSEFVEAFLFTLILAMLVGVPFAIGVKVATYFRWGCP